MMDKTIRVLLCGDSICAKLKNNGKLFTVRFSALTIQKRCGQCAYAAELFKRSCGLCIITVYSFMVWIQTEAEAKLSTFLRVQVPSSNFKFLLSQIL